MTHDLSKLNDLIEVLVDGKKFYEEAASEVRPDLRRLFTTMANTKAAIVADLQRQVAATGEKPADGGTVAGSLRKFYAEIRTAMASNENEEYVSQLEEFEDRILAAFRDASTKDDDMEVRAIAQRHMAQVKKDHDDMRALKRAAQANS